MYKICGKNARGLHTFLASDTMGSEVLTMTQRARIWLRTVRASLDQTQSQAAAAVGVSRHTFARWESGTLQPYLEQAVELAKWASAPLDEVAEAFGFELGETVAEQADRLTDCSP